MSNNPNTDSTPVSPDTDDLDAFNDLLSGNAPLKEDEEQEEVNNEEEPLAPEEDEPLDETSEEEDEQEEIPDEPSKKEPVKKVNPIQERINKLLEKERLANERAAQLEAKIAELQKGEPTQAAQPERKGPTPDDKNPDGSDKYPIGEYDPAFIRDLTRFTIEEEQAVANAKREQEEITRQHQRSLDELHQQWEAKLSPVVEQHEDFIEKTIQLEDAFDGLDKGYSDYLVNTIKSLDHGPEVLYYFANNLEEAERFVKMGPLSATLALGEINAMFKGQTRQPPKVSKAPVPPQVNKGTRARSSISPDTDSLEDFEALFFNKK